MTHVLESRSPEQYKEYEKFVLQHMDKDATKIYMSNHGLDSTSARSEIVADYTMKFLFSDEKIAREITKKHSKLAEAIRRALKWIREKLGYKMTDIERAAELWNKAYNESRRTDGAEKVAAEKKNAVQFSTASISRLTESDVRVLLERAQHGEFSNDTYIPLRINTPGVLIFEVSKYSKGETIIENLPIIMEVEKARQAMEESDGIYYEKDKPHGLDIDAMISIIEGMDNPAYIVLQENGRYTEVVTYKDKGGKTALAVLDFGNFKHAQYLNGYESGTYNILVTTYLPDSIETYLSNEDNTIIYSKKDAPQSGSGSILPSHLNGTPFYTDNVSQDSGNVKTVFGFLIEKNAKVNEDLLEELSIHDAKAIVDRRGNITVYHRTTAESAAEIERTGIMHAKEDALFFSSQKGGYATDYGDAIVSLSIPSTELLVNDIFDGEVHFEIPLKYKNGGFSLDVSKYLVKADSTESAFSNGKVNDSDSATDAIFGAFERQMEAESARRIRWIR